MSEDFEAEDLTFGKREPNTLPWFRFWANRWMGSDTVDSMSMAQQGIFVRVLCGLHIHGKLTRDVWKLANRLNIPYRPLLKWMEDFGAVAEIIHEEGCCFDGAQVLPFHSEKAAAKHYRDSTQALPKQCPCTSWTVPNFEKLQVLMGKSTPDVAGEERRREQRRRVSSSAARNAKTKTPPPRSSKDVSDEDFMELSLEKQMEFASRDCQTCSGDGTYSEDKMVDGFPYAIQTRCQCTR